MTVARSYVICFSLLVGCVVRAQQVENFSLIRENAYVLNPALCGTKGYFNTTASYRHQFTNIASAPYTIFLGMEGQIAQKNLGIGGYLINDQTGPTGLTGVGVSLAYHFCFNKNDLFKGENLSYNTEMRHMLTVGIGVSAMQYRLNGDQLHPEDPNDPDLDKIRRYQYFPDANLGVYYQYRDRFYAGISAPQLLGLNLKYALANGTSEIRKVQHLNFLVGGKIRFKKNKNKFFLEPVAAFRWTQNAPFQIDAGLRFTAFQNVWIGATYRSTSQLMLDVGLVILDYVRICYAVDLQVGGLTQQIGVSHEVAVNVRLKNKPKKKEDAQIIFR